MTIAVWYAMVLWRNSEHCFFTNILTAYAGANIIKISVSGKEEHQNEIVHTDRI